MIEYEGRSGPHNFVRVGYGEIEVAEKVITRTFHLPPWLFQAAYKC